MYMKLKKKIRIFFLRLDDKLRNFFFLHPFLNSFPNTLLICTGFTIVTYILYIRLILQRFPRELFIESISILRLIIYFNLFATFFILSIVSGYKIYKEYFNFNKDSNNENEEEEGNIKKILNWIKDKIIKISKGYSLCLLKFEHALKTKIYVIFNIDVIFLPELVLKFVKLLSPLTKYKLRIFVFAILPKIIILISLIIDTFIFHKLYYFYACGPLYLIPLGFDWLVHTLIQIPLDALHKIGEIVKIVKLKKEKEKEKDYKQMEKESEKEIEIRIRKKYGLFKEDTEIEKDSLTPIEFLKERQFALQRMQKDLNRFKRYIHLNYGYAFNTKFFEKLQAGIYCLNDPVKYLTERGMLIFKTYLPLIDITLSFSTIKDIETKYWNFFIYVGFAICWGYILIRSLTIIL